MTTNKCLSMLFLASLLTACGAGCGGGGGGAGADAIPVVSFVSPANLAVEVPLNRKLAATFSEAMDPSTISTSSFLLALVDGDTATPVAGMVVSSGPNAVFTPGINLLSDSSYRATITADARSEVGQALASNFVWTFDTGNSLDVTAPVVSFVQPANAALGVPLNRKVAVTFSEAMDPLTITGATFTLEQAAEPDPLPVVGTVTYAGIVATFTPSVNLAADTQYTATVKVGATDLALNPLAAPRVWSFTTGDVVDTEHPIVSFVDPAPLATEVPVNLKVGVTFSEPMDPRTLTAATFTLFQGTSPVVGTVTYAGLVANFTPAVNLATNTMYTATVGTEAMDLAGNALETAEQWVFSTGAISDTTSPEVSFVDPADGDIGVPVNKQVNVTFSEAMDPLSITAVTFTLEPTAGPDPIAGTVTYAGTVATFTPSANLTGSVSFTARVSVEAKDLAGNPLLEEKVWSFTTGTTEVALMPVTLGQTSHFAVLAGYAITNVPTSIIRGDVGISPAAESFITGFSQTANTGYSTSPQVVSPAVIYAADQAAPTPAMLTTAKGDMTLAYNDARDRTPVPVGDFLNIGDLAGKDLVPGLYKFTGNAFATSSFTLTGGANDVWIFQIASSFDISDGVVVNLVGALPKNVFWQVGSAAIIGTGAQFKGTLMASQSITMKTGTILVGRALAFTGTIALQANDITVPAP